MFLDKQHSTILMQKYLSSNLYFSLFTQQTIRQIAQGCTMQSFDPGELIVAEHDPISKLYFIKSGTVKVVKLIKFFKKELESYSNISTSNSTTTNESEKIDKKKLLYSEIDAKTVDLAKYDLEGEDSEDTQDEEEEVKRENDEENKEKNNSDINDFINDLNINRNLTKFDSYSNMKRPKRNDEPIYNLLHIATITSGYFPELSINQPWNVRTLQRLRVAAEQNHLKHAYASVIAEKRCECIVCPVASFITCLQEYERNALPMCFDTSFDVEDNVDDIYKQSKNAVRDLITSTSGFMNIPYEDLRNAFINERKWEIFKKETVEEVWNAHKARQERKRNKFWFMK
jgi:CRP-like cAMP-binding protein